MKLYRRRQLFYLLLLLFIVAGPILIAYSFGYTFNVFDRRVEQTGGIFIKASTPRISIWLDGAFQKETALITGGALLTDIVPNTHLIQIRKEKYHSWSKAITVEPLLVTEIRNILLVPTSFLIATSTPEEIAVLTATETPQTSITLDEKNNLVEHIILGQQNRAASPDRASSDRASTTVLLKNIHSFGVFENRILAVDWNGFIVLFDREADDIRILGRSGFLLTKKQPVRMTRSPRGEIALIDAAGGLIVVDVEKNIVPLTGGVQNLRFDAEGEKLLLQKEGAIEVVWRRDNKYQPFQKKDALETILLLRTPIRAAQWFYGDNAHIVFRADEGIFITELDGRGGRNTAELVLGPTDELITRPEMPNAVFFKKDREYFKIEL